MKFGQRFGNPMGDVDPQALYVEIPPQRAWDRRLSWTPTHTVNVVYHLLVDGEQYAVTSATSLDTVPQDARAVMEIIETSVQNADEDLRNVATPPMDRARVEWSEVAGAPSDYLVNRRAQGGAYPSTPMGGMSSGQDSYTFADGPLDDDVYEWRVSARDVAGNQADSADAEGTVSSAPSPPTGLAASLTAGMLTLTWTASPSADMDHYAVYRSAAGGLVQIDAAPLDTVAASPYTEDVSSLTGRYAWLVRAVDGDGNEEAGLKTMVALDLTTGDQVLRPNSPEILDARAVAGGEATVTALYVRPGEVGVATSVRLYADDGAGGGVDWNTLVATATLRPNATMQTVELTTTTLTGGLTYELGARARTAAGIEDENLDTVEVTTDDTAPGTPVVTVTIH